MWHIYGIWEHIGCWHIYGLAWKMKGAVCYGVLFMFWLVYALIWGQHVDYCIGYMTKNVMLHHISIILSQGMQWCHWWCFLHHVISSQMVSYNLKSHAAPHFNFLNLRNAVVPLTTLLAWYSTTTCNCGVSDQTKSCCSSFWFSLI